MSETKARPGYGCGCLSIWLVAMALYVGQLQWKFHQRDVRNAAFLADAGRIADALEAHARDHDGRFPPAPELRAAVQPLLPGGVWPDARWTRSGGPRRPLAVLTPDPAMAIQERQALRPLLGSAAAGPLPSIAPGRHLSMVPGSAPLGSLIYETDPARRHYVLYAVGGYALSDSPDGGVELPAIRLVRSDRR